MRRHLRLIAPFAVAALLAGALLALAGCGRFRPADDLPDPTAGLSETTTETVIYFSTGRTLMGERRVIDAASPYEDALRTLLEAMPQSNPDVAIVQPEAGYNSVTFEDGVITIDWQADILDFQAEDAEERLAYASILATFGAFPEVQKVRFLVDGKDSGKIDGKDIEAFWGSVSLKGQPWDVLRVRLPSASDESTPTTSAP